MPGQHDEQRVCAESPILLGQLETYNEALLVVTPHSPHKLVSKAGY